MSLSEPMAPVSPGFVPIVLQCVICLPIESMLIFAAKKNKKLLPQVFKKKNPGTKTLGSCSSAGLHNGLIGLSQDLVADLGVGDGPVFLPQVKTQLALVAEVKVTLLTLKKNQNKGGLHEQ